MNFPSDTTEATTRTQAILNAQRDQAATSAPDSRSTLAAAVQTTVKAFPPQITSFDVVHTLLTTECGGRSTIERKVGVRQRDSARAAARTSSA